MSPVIRELIEVLINSVTISSAYALLAIGLSLIYGVSKIFNYAYGSLLTVGAYFAWLMFATFAWANYLFVFVTLFVFMLLLGLIIEAAIPRTLRKKPNWEITTLIATLGLGIVLSNLMLLIFGPRMKTLPHLAQGMIDLGGIKISVERIVMLATAVSIVFGIKFFLSKTRIGLSMRAVSQDMLGARVVGLSVSKIFATTFGISTVLAGISGVFLGSIYFVSPQGGWNLFIKAFVIVALGGAGSIEGALYAAFILGTSEGLIQWGFGPLWVMPFWTLVMIGVLAIRPKGLLGIR
ncbi:MAG: branched-chain amino acid ABC transporter permease [Desulfobacterales bacterium]|nr:branched-chain amino acid ABC transporter permease [Desulfobacterales bacterium]